MPDNNSQQAAPNWLRPHGERWQVRSVERQIDNPYFAIDAYDAIAPTGAPSPYFVMVKKALAIGVIPLHEDGTVTMVGQWRFPFGTYSWELPEGGVDPGEDALDGAKRELSEEVGLKASDWRQIVSLHLSNASTDERCVGYLATGLEPCTGHVLDDTEDLAVERVPFREVIAAVIDGHIEDAITVAMVLRLHHMAVTNALHPALTKVVLS